jgi:hypothetical protein
MKENGYWARKKEEEYSSKQTIHRTQENGKEIRSTATGNRNGQTGQSIKAIFILEKKKDTESLKHQMENMRVSSRIIAWKVMVISYGMMEKNIKAFGKRIK